VRQARATRDVRTVSHHVLARARTVPYAAEALVLGRRTRSLRASAFAAQKRAREMLAREA
jgi:hypothetical protein